MGNVQPKTITQIATDLVDVFCKTITQKVWIAMTELKTAVPYPPIWIMIDCVVQRGPSVIPPRLAHSALVEKRDESLPCLARNTAHWMNCPKEINKFAMRRQVK